MPMKRVKSPKRYLVWPTPLVYFKTFKLLSFPLAFLCGLAFPRVGLPFQNLLQKDTKILVNPSGRFVLGGPAADAGQTGRKIVSDANGDVAYSGGRCYSHHLDRHAKLLQAWCEYKLDFFCLKKPWACGEVQPSAHIYLR